MRSNPEETPLSQALQQFEARVRPNFRADVLPRELTVFQFETTREVFHLRVTRDDFGLAPGAHPKPTLRLFVPTRKHCFELLSGERDGMEAFLAGDYRSDGNILLTQLLLYLFPPTAGDFQLVRD